MINQGLSVREAEALARRATGRADAPKAPRAPKAAPAKDADTRALEEDLAEMLGLAVEVADRGGSGEVRIRYETLEQLDELCRRLTRV